MMPASTWEVPRTGNYQKYASRNPMQRFLIWYFHRWVHEFLGTTGASSVLDVGCGEGFTITRLSGLNRKLPILGLDSHFPALVQASEANPGVVFCLGDAGCLPFASDSYEAVICLEVLEHLPDPCRALEELRRVTSRYCLISVPNEPFFRAANLLRGKNLRRLGNDPEHVHNWTARQFLEMINAHFALERVVYPFPWVMALCTK
jgi:ubiquinone/menaquinone biosynthesis C-methylase UbiE